MRQYIYHCTCAVVLITLGILLALAAHRIGYRQGCRDMHAADMEAYHHGWR